LASRAVAASRARAGVASLGAVKTGSVPTTVPKPAIARKIVRPYAGLQVGIASHRAASGGAVRNDPPLDAFGDAARNVLLLDAFGDAVRNDPRLDAFCDAAR
jgi:hypothetical protein